MSAIQTLSRRSFIAGTAALGAAAVVAPQAAFADDAASKQAEADAALASLKNMQTSLDEASNEYTQALADQEEAQSKMDEAQTQIDEQTGKIEDYQKQLGTRARSMYRTGSNTFLDVLLGSSTFEEFSSNWDILNSMNDQDAELVSETKTAREQIEASKQQYAEQEQVAAQKTAEAAEIKSQAEATVASMQSVYDNLSAEAAVLLEQERAAQAAAAAAQAEAVVAASAAAAQSNAAADTGNTNTGTSGSSSSNTTSAVYEGGSDAVSRAYACMGAPYSWGAVGPNAYDCSGLVSYCLTGSHSRLGTTYTFMAWPQASNPSPGDVAVNSSHCGIYIGGGQMIHAADYGIGVIVGPVQSGMIIVRYA
jgi:peptidoglycan hydrolase CwlO-like protein